MTSKSKLRVALLGASGYTGKLITHAASSYDINLLLLGRSQHKLRALSDRVGYPFQTVTVPGGSGLCQSTLQESLHDVDVMINAAGPFSATAQPVVEACLASNTHYLDITGEIPVFEKLFSYHEQAVKQGIMVMPGVGFAIVASDCLAAHVASRLPDAVTLNIGVSRSDIFSRGSARTMLELFDNGVLVRRSGVLEKIPVASLEQYFNFGAGPRSALAVSWPDVFTAYHSTGIDNIATFFEVGAMERSIAMYGRYAGWTLQLPFARQAMQFQMSLLPEGPSQQCRDVRNRVIVAEAIAADGNCVRSRLTTPEAYTFSALSTLEIVKRVVDGEYHCGFQTPASVYGAELLQAIPDIHCTDIS